MFAEEEHQDPAIWMAVNASLDDNHNLASLERIENLYAKAGFDNKAKDGLLAKKLKEHPDLSYFMLIKKLRLL